MNKPIVCLLGLLMFVPVAWAGQEEKEAARAQRGNRGRDLSFEVVPLKHLELRESAELLKRLDLELKVH